MHVRFLSCSLYLSRGAHAIATIVADCNYHIFVLMSIILLKKNQNTMTFLDCASLYGCTFYSLFLSISFRFFHSESDFFFTFFFILFHLWTVFFLLSVLLILYFDRCSVSLLCKMLGMAFESNVIFIFRWQINLLNV